MKGVRIKIGEEPISGDEVLRLVSSKEAGGTVMFVGTVRNSSRSLKVTRMQIECASDLARKDLERIAGAAMRKFTVLRVAVLHRTGALKVGDTIVAIAVSAPHRKNAFNACSFIINELKKSTPIWKKESGPRGQRWVECRG